jgi:LysR family glycine cleavage system transcriptional activator
MGRLRPPLNAVRAFEAAARHSSFTRAADELFVTPGAVSRQVRILEDLLGKSLFERNYREVRLTDAARTYAKALSDSLTQIDHATRNFLASEQAKALHVHAPMTFALLWLMPRLASYHASHPSQGFRLTSAGTPQSDLAGSEFDVVVKRLISVAPGDMVRWLFDVELVPICSPDFAERHALREPADLVGQMLLYSVVRPDDWSKWLAKANVEGVDLQEQIPFESSSLAYRAATSGLGVAIATRAFVEEDVASGRLVVPFDIAVRDGSAYHAVLAPAARSDPNALAFCEWIAGEAGAKKASPMRGSPA